MLFPSGGTCFLTPLDGEGKGKALAVNMLIVEVADVQQVTTHRKAKLIEWEAQKVVRKTTKKRVEQENQRNADKMQ